MNITIIIYYLCFIISFIEIPAYVYIQQNRINIRLIVIYLLVAFSNLGYLALSVSTNIEEAILATKISYIGGIFLPFFVMIMFLELCKTEISYTISWIISLVNSIIMTLVLTIGYSDIYYKTQELIIINGVSKLNRTYGIAHNLRLIVLFLEITYMCYAAVKAYRSNKQISLKTINAFLVIIALNLITFIFQTNFNKNLELMPVMYTISATVILYLNTRIEMYNASVTINSLVNKMEKYGYITFDNKYNYMGSNEFVREIFPELENVYIDSNIPENLETAYSKFEQWVKNWEEGQNNAKYLDINGHILRCNISRLKHGYYERKIGYIIEIIDDTQNQKYIKLIDNYNKQLKEEVDAKAKHIENIQDSILIGIATMVESRDNSTGGHINRTSKCIKIFVKELIKHKDIFRYDKEFLENIIKAAPLHDIGKIAIDDDILKKPGKFTEEEYQEMKTHAAEGAKLLNKVLKEVDDKGFTGIAINIAHYHHERWDGTGYPDKLKYDSIPFEARVMALVDVFDALVSKRCYKEAYSYNRAFSIIQDELGKQFDPQLGKYFLKCRHELMSLYDNIGDT